MWVFTSCYQVSVFSPSHRPEKTGICKEERWQPGTNYAERYRCRKILTLSWEVGDQMIIQHVRPHRSGDGLPDTCSNGSEKTKKGQSHSDLLVVHASSDDKLTSQDPDSTVDSAKQLTHDKPTHIDKNMKPYMKHAPRIVRSLRNFHGIYGTGAKYLSQMTNPARHTTPSTIMRMMYDCKKHPDDVKLHKVVFESLHEGSSVAACRISSILLALLYAPNEDEAGRHANSTDDDNESTESPSPRYVVQKGRNICQDDRDNIAEANVSNPVDCIGRRVHLNALASGFENGSEYDQE
ncbi:hypothetical protein KC354_g131 [Hortaea werneckii]|nr:hypothetical protein KC354_g131 [Hortaea werneckii]